MIFSLADNLQLCCYRRPRNITPGSVVPEHYHPLSDLFTRFGSLEQKKAYG